MSVRVGDTLLTGAYVGDDRVTQIRLGDVQVFQLGKPYLDGRKMLRGLNTENGRYTEVKTVIFRLSGAPSSYVRTWDASEYSNGSVTAYLTEGGELVVSGNGNGRLIPDARFELQSFSNLEHIYGWDCLDGSGRCRVMNYFRFCSSLKELPPHTFAGWGLTSTSPASRDAIQVCQGCTSLESIPEDMFAGSVFTEYDYAFDGCTSLKTLPPRLFAGNTRMDNIQYMFRGSGLTAVPDGLFAGCTGIKQARRAFENCADLVTIGTGIFDGADNVENCTAMFDQCTAVTSAVPALWEQWPSMYYYDHCFRGCVNAANYSEIPSGWRN